MRVSVSQQEVEFEMYTEIITFTYIIVHFSSTRNDSFFSPSRVSIIMLSDHSFSFLTAERTGNEKNTLKYLLYLLTFYFNMCFEYWPPTIQY